MALMLSNHPHFLDAFFGLQKTGAYAVPVNTALVGDGLAYILNHSEVQAIVCDHETAAKIAALRERLPAITRIWVNTAEAPADFSLPAGMEDFSVLETGGDSASDNPGLPLERQAPGLLLYTSGTTGQPKAVVSTYDKLRTKSIGILAQIINAPDDRLYTCLPLFHANALLLGVMTCLWTGIPLCLGKRFSASRFWQEVSECRATLFYTVEGAQILDRLADADGVDGKSVAFGSGDEHTAARGAVQLGHHQPGDPPNLSRLPQKTDDKVR